MAEHPNVTTVRNVIGALNSAVSLYYYARIIRAMFIDKGYEAHPAPIKTSPVYSVLLASAATAVLVFGLWWTPIIDWSARSLQMFKG